VQLSHDSLGSNGLASADVRRARVLELGCCSGGNLIPMAEQLPDATFVGLDAGRGVGEVAGLALA